MAKNLVWVASYPKSGSTWMRLFIHAYLAGRTGIDSVGRGDVGDLNRPLYEAVSPILLDEVPDRETIFLRTAALYGLSLREGNQLVKTHCARRVTDGIELIPPEMTKGAIHIVRDPRDVAISFAHHLGKDIDHAITLMGKEATIWKENLGHYLSTWSTHTESWSKGPFPILRVRYEDLPDDFARIAHFLTGEIDEERLDFAVDATRFDKIQKEEQMHGFKEQSKHTDRFFRVGRSTWREVLTDAQIATIEHDHGPVMKELGYPLVSISETAA